MASLVSHSQACIFVLQPVLLASGAACLQENLTHDTGLEEG